MVLLTVLQAQLWFGGGGVMRLQRLHQEEAHAKFNIEQMEKRNQALEAEVADLRRGGQAIEEQARSELGMIRQGETFYLVVHPN